MTKAEYRQYFRIMSRYVKITKFLPDVRISQSNMSKFLNDETGHNDDRISIKKLNDLYHLVRVTMYEIV